MVAAKMRTPPILRLLHVTHRTDRIVTMGNHSPSNHHGPPVTKRWPLNNIIMTDLANRLLASIENHGRSAVTGMYKLYPHETKEAILAALYELKEAGWVKITMKTIEAFEGSKHVKKKVEKNVSRTSKQYYSQPSLDL